jgi:hypothetical protein
VDAVGEVWGRVKGGVIACPIQLYYHAHHTLLLHSPNPFAALGAPRSAEGHRKIRSAEKCDSPFEREYSEIITVPVADLNPHYQHAQIQDLIHKVDELINALRR